MPNEFSNFTTQDTDRPDGGYQGGYTQGGSDDGSHRWDPNAYNEHTGKNGKWVPIDQRESVPTFDKGAWGGMGERLDGNGNPIAGTDGANVDRERYLGMQGPIYEHGPTIDQTRGQESRGWGMGALDLLKRTAEGKQPSVAEKLGTQQGIDAQNARMGIAASVRGGAAARGAAARAGQADASTIGQQTLQSNAATRAGEMEQARGAFLGAATGQRAQDLNVATEQGGLEMGQRAANDQRDSFYANRAQDVNRVQTASRLGASANDINARDAAARQAEARQANADAHQQKVISTGVAMGNGAAGAYGKAYNDGSGDDNDDTTSDENAKDNVEPVKASRAIRARARKAASQ